jgi:thiol:disulfide interchange protein
MSAWSDFSIQRLIIKEDQMRLPFAAIAIVMIASLVAVSCSAKTPAAKDRNNVEKNTAVSAVGTASTVPPAKYDTMAQQKTLLFFINPNGRPCQIQEKVLAGMNEKLSALAKIQSVKTTDPSARALFEKYGIRGLPLLIVLDQSGKELTRFPPGIQSEETILAALKKK